MDYKPSDFFLSFSDFFAVLVPGALACFLFMKDAQNLFDCAGLPELSTVPEKWVAFTIASYLVGHFLSSLGSALVNPLYDQTYEKFKRWRGGDKLRQHAMQLKKNAFADSESDIASNFAWAKTVVNLRSPAGATEIERFDGICKLFRSLVLILLAALAKFTLQGDQWPSLTALGLLLVTFWRYSELRWKRAKCVYLYFVAITEQTDLRPTAEKPERLRRDAGDRTAVVDQ